jgi:hypothetical protein
MFSEVGDSLAKSPLNISLSNTHLELLSVFAQRGMYYELGDALTNIGQTKSPVKNSTSNKWYVEANAAYVQGTRSTNWKPRG